MCGLAGFYPKKGKIANINIIFAMGIMNENRGTDSCGISIGNYIEKGIDKESDARVFIDNNRKNIIKRLVSDPIIFHTRKSTYGSHIYDNAHPFHWYLPDNKKNYFVFAHNGTLEDWRSMITNWNIQGDSKLVQIDSHALGLAIYKAIRTGQDFDHILTKYKGAAAFLGYNDDMFLVWKGANNNIVERPMYYIENSDGWYFHSQELILSLLFPDKHVYEVDNNTLLVFKNNKLFNKIEYKREYQYVSEKISNRLFAVKELFKKHNPLHMLILNSKTLTMKVSDEFKLKKNRKNKAKFEENFQILTPFDEDSEKDFLSDTEFLYSIDVNRNINSYNYAKYTSSKGAILNGTFYFELTKQDDNFSIKNKYSYNVPKSKYHVPIIFINGVAFHHVKNIAQDTSNLHAFIESVESCLTIQQLNNLVNEQYKSNLFKNLVSYIHIYNDLLDKHVIIYKSFDKKLYTEITEEIPTLITFYDELVGIENFKTII